MDIPAHRAAAVEPTPAHTFELQPDGSTANLTEPAAAEPVAPVAASLKGRKAAEPAADTKEA